MMLGAFVPVSGTAAQARDPVVVFAAASLGDAFDDVAQAFEEETGHPVVVSYAGSAALARQILLGAPADLYISADPQWADALQQGGRVEPGRRHDLLGNTLVLIGHGPATEATLAATTIDGAFDFEAALGEGRIAMGLVESVPAGRYARAALQTIGAWDGLAGRTAQTDNVRAALALVATGAAPLGIVYATDARAESGVHVLGRFPTDSHPRIVYPIVDVNGRDTPGENALFDYLQGPVAAAIFRQHGFIVPGTAP